MSDGHLPPRRCPLIVARGTPEEIGRSYGIQAARLIHHNVGKYLRRIEHETGGTAARIEEAGATFRAETWKRWPRIALMLDSLASAADVSRENVFALNARTELLHGYASSTLSGGCTSLVVAPDLTGNGHTIIAQNWDWHPDQSESMLLLATIDEVGHRVLVFAEAGMLAKAGLNSAGIGVCVNLLASSNDGIPGGVPYHVILRAVLESRDFEEAVLAAVDSPRSASLNVMIAGRCGDAIDLELSPGQVGRIVLDGLITHGNHFETTLACDDLLAQPARNRCSQGRAARARRMLREGSTGQHKISVDDVRHILSCHGADPICLHPIGQVGAEQSATLASMIIDVEEGCMYFADGPPCETDFRRLGFDQVEMIDAS